MPCRNMPTNPLRTASALVAAALLPVLCAAQTAASAPAPGAEISRAEHLVFTDPHLSNLRPGTVLHYRFRRSGPLDAEADDRFTLNLGARPDGTCCRADGGFDSVVLDTTLPAVEDARSNPVVLFFLEQDIRAMQRRTKGQANYFRKRIRMALAERFEVRDVTVQWDGKALPAHEVHIRPYVDDPLRERFETLATKHYVFTLAAGVPGGVFDLRSWVPAAGDADTVAGSPLAEIMTLADAAASAPTKARK